MLQVGGIGILIIGFFFLLWIWNSINIIKEWERGVVLRLGRLIARGEGRRSAIGFLADRNTVSHQHAAGDAGRPAAGHHHARQRFGEGKRSLLFPCCGRQPCAVAGAELSVCDFAACTDDASQRRWTVRTGRDSVATR